MGEYFGEKEAVRKRIVGNMILAYQSAGMGMVPSCGQGGKRGLVNGDMRMLVRHDFQWALARLTGGVHKPDIRLDNLEPGPPPVKPGNH
jgi:hypothetical protein